MFVFITLSMGLFAKGGMKALDTKFRVLAEIALREPKVKQAEVAEALEITPQAVYELFKRLADEGLITGGKGRYKLTDRGYELLITGAREINALAKRIFSGIERRIKYVTAIAEQSMSRGERVELQFKKGLLYATPKRDGSAVVVNECAGGEDVAVITEEIPQVKGSVKLFIVPPVERGGSRGVDINMLSRVAAEVEFLCALGVEALVACLKAGIKPDAFFGSIEAGIEAYHHGCSVLFVAVEDEIYRLVERLRREKISSTQIPSTSNIV